MILVSIIVPIYNVEKYVERCIDSIINQTLKEIEIILVDDGSTDNSGKICDEYARRDERIKVIHKKNGGQCSARNVGLDIAKGEYIGFVDSDDFIKLYMYEILYLQINKYNADIIKCNFVDVIDGQIKQYEESNLTTIYDTEKAFYNFINEPYRFNKHFKAIMWDGLYKTKLFEEIRFPEGFIYEEGYVLPKLFLKSNKLVHLDKNLYYYVKNKKGTMAQGLNENGLKSIDDWKEIHYLLYDKYPMLNKYTAYRWIDKYLNLYKSLYYRKDIDKNDYYKNYIRCELKNRISYFQAIITDKKILKKVRIFNYNPKLYLFFLKYKII